MCHYGYFWGSTHLGEGAALKINEVESLVGISKKNIRFYEQEGLLSPKRNSENSYRDYSEEDVAILKEIRLLRRLSVPLDEIRKLQLGTHTAQDTMRRQMIALQLQMDSLYHASLLCNKIDQSGLGLGQLDIDQYLAEMDQMESDGLSFANVQKRDTTGKYILPMAVTLAVVTLMMAFLYMLFWNFMEARPSVAVMILAFIVPVAVAGCVIAAMLAHIKALRLEDSARGKKSLRE